MSAYADFISTKWRPDIPTGIDVSPSKLNPKLFPFQRDVVAWALRRGRAALFEDCGLGKTFQQLEWAKHVPGRVLILTPLAVADQTVREGERFGIDAVYCRDGSTTDAKIVVTNYEMLSHFDPDDFVGVVLDESSILKNFSGKIKRKVIESFSDTPFRLACTATPAPNDFLELGNHSEFLGVLTSAEMLAMYFTYCNGVDEHGKWRLKGHAESGFWRWMCSWAVTIRKPSDIGHDDSGFELPAIRLHQHEVESAPPTTSLFQVEARDLRERLDARRETIADRAAKCAEIVNAKPDEPWVVWCNLNAEADTIARLVDGAVNVQGSDSLDKKESAIRRFSDGDIRVLVTKPKIAGFGMNWQHCANVAFLGLSDSWEAYYQAVRRCWRFGQTETVNVHIVTADREGAVVRNIERKERNATEMGDRMVENMSDITKNELANPTTKEMAKPEKRVVTESGWTAHNGDCVDVVSGMEDESIDYSVFSPPFASLFTFSDSPYDLGNCEDHDTFHEHMGFLIEELYRVTKPGRLCSFHCALIPMSKNMHGQIGIFDFRGELIRAFVKAGFIFHSEVTIWKDPVLQMMRTKAIGLLHKQVKKDSSISRQGMPDYLVTVRKPGENSEPIAGNLMEKYAQAGISGEAVLAKLRETDNRKTGGRSGPDRPSIDLWQKYASPIWMDIDQTRTLQYRGGKDDKDERHICPLQLDVIERALLLWSNYGDLVLSPFMGIGSEGRVAIEMGRRFVGVELKPSYYDQALRNLRAPLTQRLF